MGSKKGKASLCFKVGRIYERKVTKNTSSVLPPHHPTSATQLATLRKHTSLAGKRWLCLDPSHIFSEINSILLTTYIYFVNVEGWYVCAVFIQLHACKLVSCVSHPDALVCGCFLLLLCARATCCHCFLLLLVVAAWWCCLVVVLRGAAWWCCPVELLDGAVW